MKILAKTLYGFLIIFLMLVAGVFLASIVPVPGHISIKIVKSGSMEPAIHVGSIVVIQPQKAYHVGEVITFGPDTKVQIPTTHRIVEAGNDNGATVFTTKGDANEDPDPNRAKLTDVEGKVLFTVPYAGYVLDFAKKPLGFGLMIAVPATIIILDELVRIFNEMRNLRAGNAAPARKRREDEERDSGEVSMQELREQTSPQNGVRKNIDGVTHRARIL